MFCPKCGATNDDASKFCLSCGGPLGEPAAAPTAAPPPAQTYYQPPPPAPPVKKGHAGIIVVIVLVLVLAIGAAAVFFLMSNKDDKDDKTTAAQTTVSASTTKQANNNNATTAAPDDEQPDADAIRDILNDEGLGNWDGNWNNLTPEQKAAIEGYYSLLGDNVRITDDGVVMVDEDGNVVTWGGKWPNHPLTNKVPKPEYGAVFASDVKDDIVTVTYTGWTAEQYMDYVKKVKQAGFDKDVEEVNAFGVQSFTANDGDIKISVSQAFGMYMITIEKTS